MTNYDDRTTSDNFITGKTHSPTRPLICFFTIPICVNRLFLQPMTMMIVPPGLSRSYICLMAVILSGMKWMQLTMRVTSIGMTGPDQASYVLLTRLTYKHTMKLQNERR